MKIKLFDRDNILYRGKHLSVFNITNDGVTYEYYNKIYNIDSHVFYTLISVSNIENTLKSEILNAINLTQNIGIFVGRMCPIHKGHMKAIDYMINTYGFENSAIFIDSSNSKINFRTLFSYYERAKWVKAIYPLIRVLGLPDNFSSNEEWLYMLNDYIDSIFPNKKKNITFIGGSEKDIEVFHNNGKQVHVIGREDQQWSGTNIRQILLQSGDISKFVEPSICEDVKLCFRKRLKQLDESY